MGLKFKSSFTNFKQASSLTHLSTSKKKIVKMQRVQNYAVHIINHDIKNHVWKNCSDFHMLPAFERFFNGF